MIGTALFSSASENWATPQDLFDSLDYIFNFTLDPCSGPTNFKVSNHFTKEDDGLSKDWGGHKVFCNPPYGRNATGDWIKKSFEESKKPGTIVVVLIPARTDTKWFHEYVYKTNAEIFFIKGRLKFGDSDNAAPFPSMLVIFGFQWMYMKNKNVLNNPKYIQNNVERVDNNEEQ